MGVASHFADFQGRYARDKGYGLNKRLNAILLHIDLAIQEIPVELFLKGISKNRRDYRRHYVIVLLKEDCSSKTIDLLQ